MEFCKFGRGRSLLCNFELLCVDCSIVPSIRGALVSIQSSSAVFSLLILISLTSAESLSPPPWQQW